jgi:hypothetical protein
MIEDTSGREVTVSDTGAGAIGIHSWQDASAAEDSARFRASRSIFLDVDNAKRVRDLLTREIDHAEGRWRR